METNIVHNTAKQQFELPLADGSMALVTYSQKGSHLNLMHSEVPREHRGEGIGKELVLKTFEAIEKEGLTATAYCSYIRAVAQRSNKWKNIIQ